MKICKKCKKQVANKTRICKYCGADVSKVKPLVKVGQSKNISQENQKLNNEKINPVLKNEKNQEKQKEVQNLSNSKNKKQTNSNQKNKQKKATGQVKKVSKNNKSNKQEQKQTQKKQTNNNELKPKTLSKATPDKASEVKNKSSKTKNNQNKKTKNSQKKPKELTKKTTDKSLEIKDKFNQKQSKNNENKKLNNNKENLKNIDAKAIDNIQKEKIPKQKEEPNLNQGNKKLKKEKIFFHKTKELLKKSRKIIKIKNKKVIISSLGISLLIVGILICSISLNWFAASGDNKEKRQEATGNKIFAEGDLISYKGVDYKVTKVETSKGNSYKEPKEGNQFFIVTIYIKNNTDKKIVYSYENWTMSNSLGKETKRIFTSVNVDTALYSGKLVIGGIKTGSMVFEQPIKDEKLRLNFYDLKKDKNGEYITNENKKVFSVSIKVPEEIKKQIPKSKKTNEKTKTTKKRSKKR